MCGAVDALIRVFFASALVGNEWPVSRLCHFTHEEMVMVTHWTGARVGPHNRFGRREENT